MEILNSSSWDKLLWIFFDIPYSHYHSDCEDAPFVNKGFSRKYAISLWCCTESTWCKWRVSMLISWVLHSCICCLVKCFQVILRLCRVQYKMCILLLILLLSCLLIRTRMMLSSLLILETFSTSTRSGWDYCPVWLHSMVCLFSTSSSLQLQSEDLSFLLKAICDVYSVVNYHTVNCAY